MSPHHDDRDGICRIDGSRTVSAPITPDFVAARSLKRQLLEELRTSWEEGQPIPPEDLLRRWPTNPQADPDVGSLLSEDYWQRRQQGQQPTSEEYACRFPGQKESIASLLAQQALLRSCGGMGMTGSRLMALPVAGDELFGFRLCHELGHGSFARVFLAEQKMLAGRPVVVKVSAVDGNEPQTLAQLQHTHIVPIYSVHEDGPAGLRVVCMPYFGGATLTRVLQALQPQKTVPTHGKQLAAALSELGSAWLPADAAAQPLGRRPLALLTRLPYVDAAAWIIARLAEALQHAHQRGILHRDVKPSNILLCEDGQPMLLDFNLAETLQPNRVLAGTSLGGTVAYMAPEHLAALVLRDPTLAGQVDHRSDLYGLGMVFYELLTGRSPFEQNPGNSPSPAQMEAMAIERANLVPSLRRHRPDVPWSLESITRKCLDPDPSNRYQQAEHLAEDLRRYLEDCPLKYAPELSWRERASKWRRRHPRLAVSGWIAAAAAILLAAGMADLSRARSRAHEGDKAVARETMQCFLKDAQQARSFLNATIGDYSPLRDGLAFCEKALGYYNVLQREDWQEQTSWQLLGQKEQKEVAREIRELLLLWTRARIMKALTKTDPELPSTIAPSLALGSWSPLPVTCLVTVAVPVHAALQEGLHWLQRAYAIGEPEAARAICEDRAVYLQLLGQLDEAKATAQEAKDMRPITARDYYLLGSSYARNGRYSDAIRELKLALRLNRQDYWSHFYLGMCFRQQGNYIHAAKEFGACTALEDFSWGHFNLGEAFHHLGNKNEAIDEYTAALECKPQITQAYFNRGLVCLDLGKWQEALEDFDGAIQRGCNEDALHGVRGIALTHLGRKDEATLAFTKAWASGRKNLDILMSYAFLISRRQPQEAHDIFLQVLDQDRDNARAWYGRGMLLEHQAPDSEKAVACFTRAIASKPTFVEARLARAVIRARQGRGDTALEDIALCMDLERTAKTLYGAACFYALLSEKKGDALATLWAESALELLDKALRQGYGHDQAVTDSDLDGIRRLPQFGELLARATEPEDSQ